MDYPKCMLEGGKTHYTINGEEKERLNFSKVTNVCSGNLTR